VVLMAPRPGRIVQDLEVHLPMPRSPEDAKLDEMARYLRRQMRDMDVSSEEVPPTRPGPEPRREAAMPALRHAPLGPARR
jgi:NitT/TauT family transport system ATP-binding protein